MSWKLEGMRPEGCHNYAISTSRPLGERPRTAASGGVKYHRLHRSAQSARGYPQADEWRGNSKSEVIRTATQIGLKMLEKRRTKTGENLEDDECAILRELEEDDGDAGAAG